MANFPTFQLYGHGDAKVMEAIQPSLALREWSELSKADREIIYQQLVNQKWVSDHSSEVLATIQQLNHDFLRQCPGKKLHALGPGENNVRYSSTDDWSKRKVAREDFEDILIGYKSGPLVVRMLSQFARSHIKSWNLQRAQKEEDEDTRVRLIAESFKDFDRLAFCLNHIFEQFNLNLVATRAGFVPRQDSAITTAVYEPTLRALSDPKWQPVSVDLAKVFEDFSDKNYSEAITKAHAAVQRFLQILVGEEGKNGRGEVGKLYQEAKSSRLIKTSRFSEQLVNLVQSSIVAERATNSTAKPTLQEASAADAILTMNLVMVFLQHCLTAA